METAHITEEVLVQVCGHEETNATRGLNQRSTDLDSCYNVGPACSMFGSLA